MQVSQKGSVRFSRTTASVLAGAIGMVLAGNSAHAAVEYTMLKMGESTSPGPRIAISSHLNNTGVATGYEDYSSSGGGYKPIRWDVATGTPTVLNPLGATSTGQSQAFASMVNDSGTAVGGSAVWGAGDVSMGSRPVVWPAGSSNPVQMTTLSTRADGYSVGGASLINGSGAIAGNVRTYSGSTDLGPRAVRWDSAGAITELNGLGVDANGAGETTVYGINSTGTIVGTSLKYSGGTNLGYRAVRWDAGAATPVELPAPDPTPGGYTRTQARGINAAGTIVGHAASNTSGSLGERGARWDAGSTTGVLLQGFGSYTSARAEAINSAGAIVGSAHIGPYNGDFAEHAVLWMPGSNVAVDLNTLVAPDSQYTLAYATDINDAGQILATAIYDPDGDRSNGWMYRAVVLSPVSAVPEPSLLAPALLAAGTLASGRRRLTRRSTAR